jgi:hypothetical protein
MKPHVNEPIGSPNMQSSFGIEPIGSPTIIYEDNVACVTQMQSGYMKSNVTKHITHKLFYLHKLQQSGEIITKHITHYLVHAFEVLILCLFCWR